MKRALRGMALVLALIVLCAPATAEIISGGPRKMEDFVGRGGTA